MDFVAAVTTQYGTYSVVTNVAECVSNESAWYEIIASIKSAWVNEKGDGIIPVNHDGWVKANREAWHNVATAKAGEGFTVGSIALGNKVFSVMPVFPTKSLRPEPEED